MGQIRGKFVRSIFLLTVANTCFASAAVAQHVWVDPRGEAKVTWSDNINLDPKGEKKESGFVLNASAGFNTRIEGRKLKGALDYAADYYYFLNDGGTDLRHSMFGVLDAELIKNHLSVNTRASVRQVFLSQSDSISHNAANRSDNRRMIQNYTGSALLKGGMREFADWRVTYRYGLTLSSADNLDDETLPVNFSDSQTHEIQASIGSGYRFNNLEWRLFGRSSTVYRNLDVNDYRNDQVGGEVWYKFNRHFQIVGEVSHSRNNFQRDVLKEQGFGWDAGFRWTPGPKLDLTVRRGEVGNRKTWSARMQYLFTTRFDFAGTYTDTLSADSIVLNDNLQTWQFNEEQGITDTQNLPVDERDPRFTLSDVDFRRQNATGVFTLRKKRTQIYLSGNLEWRTYDDDTGTNSTWGASTGFKHRVDRNTTLNGTFSYRHSRFGDDSRVDNYIVGNLQWNERLSRYFKFTVSLDHTQRLSNSEGLDLMENAVTVHLRGTF